jgi:hypothetical protein
MADDNDLVEYGEAADIGANETTYAIAKNFFNFEGIGPIESDVVVVDEVELFVDTARAAIASGKKAVMNDMFNQIFAFFAVMAYQANLTAGEMKAADHGLAMTITYTDLVSNLSMKEDWHDIFFSKWPGDELPQEYKTWADEKFNRAKNGKDAGLQAWVDKECSKYSGCIRFCLVLLYITLLI